MRIAREFPRRTEATPTDELAFIGECPDPKVIEQLVPDLGEVHVSCAYTYDLPEAERLAKLWEVLGVPVKVGGPAYGLPAGEHIPGMYVKPGIVFTSRGCPNHCWFCRVPRVEGALRTYPIHDGFNVCDDNLLACPEDHVRAVFAMLDRQKERPVLTGGLEAARLKPWHVELLRKSGLHHMFFAYDTPDDYEPLVVAGRMLADAGYTFNSHALRAYVLIGYKGDTFEKAEKRLYDTLRAGFWPMAMLYKDEAGHEDKEWRRFQGGWVRPAELHAKVRDGEIVI